MAGAISINEQQPYLCLQVFLIHRLNHRHPDSYEICRVVSRFFLHAFEEQYSSQHFQSRVHLLNLKRPSPMQPVEPNDFASWFGASGKPRVNGEHDQQHVRITIPSFHIAIPSFHNELPTMLMRVPKHVKMMQTLKSLVAMGFLSVLLPIIAFDHQCFG